MSTPKKPVQYSGLALLLWSVTTVVAAAPVHQHGLAEAAVVVEGDSLTVSFRAPVMDILGTEHPPEDTAARLGYTKRLAKIGVPRPSPEAQCELTGAAGSELGSLFPDDHDHGGHHHHTDVENEWVFSCEAPAQLKRVAMPFLGTFSHLTTEVILLLPGGQSWQRLSQGEQTILLE